MSSAMGRRRQNNIDLPPHMHVKSGTYYYVTSDTPRKWISLGKDIAKARRKWAELEGGETGSSISLMIDEWLDKPNDLAESTMINYRSVAIQLKEFYKDSPVEAFKPQHVAAWMDAHHSRARANLGKAVLANVFDVAIRRGLLHQNPAREIKRLNVKPRRRDLTDTEFLQIRNHATAPLVCAMDIAYVTGARISDVIAIKREHITEAGVLIRQQKTKKLQLFQWTDALHQVIEAAKKLPRSVRGMQHLLCTNKGSKYSYATMYTWWCQAVEKSGVTDANFHDIRAKTADAAEREGIDYQALLGHSTKAMSDRYLKSERPSMAEPLSKKL